MSLVHVTPQVGDAVSTAALTSVGATAGQVLAANGNRKGFSVTNTGTTTLYLVLGFGTPTATVYHYPLAACAVTHDGKGGTYTDESWLGAVQAIGSAAGGSCVIAEFT